MKVDSWQDKLPNQKSPIQTTLQHQLTDSRVEPPKPSKEIMDLYYNLSNSFSVINSAIYMVKIKKITKVERDQYLEALDRNIAKVKLMLSTLNDLLQLEATNEIYLAKSPDVAEMLRELKIQLPRTAPKEFEEQIKQLTQLVETLPY